MSVLFIEADNDSMGVDVASVVAAPITIAGWLYPTDVANEQYAAGLYDASDGNSRFSLVLLGGDAGDPLAAETRVGATERKATTSTGVTVNTWHHGAAVFAAADDRRAYIDGGSKGTEATSVIPTGIDKTALGRRGAGPAFRGYSGRIAEVGIWDVALTDAEVAALARGVSPLRIRSSNLLNYYPLMGTVASAPDYGGSSHTPSAVGGSPLLAPPAPGQPAFGVGPGWGGVPPAAPPPPLPAWKWSPE